MDWAASVAGFFVGGLIGMTGIGAGSLMAPLLILWFGVPPLQAIGSDLVYSAVTKSVGAVEHVRLRNVDFRAVAWMAAASVPTSVIVVWLFARLDALAHSADHLILRALGVVLILAGVALLARALLQPMLGGAWVAARPLLLGAGGAVLGGTVGVTATGSGTLGTVLLSLATRLEARRVVGTVIVHAMLVTSAAALAHLALGDVRLGLAASLLVGSVPGVVIGSRVTIRIPDVALRAILAALLIAIGVRFEIAAGNRATLAAAPQADAPWLMTHTATTHWSSA